MLNAAIIICSTEFHDRHCFVSYKQLNTNCGSVINKQTQGCLPLAPMPKNKCHHFQCSDNASWLELLFPAPWRPELILIPRFKKTLLAPLNSSKAELGMLPGVGSIWSCRDRWKCASGRRTKKDNHIKGRPSSPSHLH